ncbi:hypothetical protein GH714_022734 [Hevea brasiliensis]|uniref:Fe2OG dioxygenase domain-containing protein n=1 Tax=Hevea brasiliensis TaxID=3981 RepID=A0A6A6LMG3_HEVBR|nr:hypothetical protein GH714_022734 [Hevea brasiliensis]
MGSETPLRLPVIDFSKEELKPGTEEWESVKSQVRKALEEYGCFEALFNKVPAELRKGIVGAMEELFELPLQTKLRNVSKKPFHGYVGQYPQAPLYESMGIDDANISQNVDSLTSVLWPQGNPIFRVMKYKGPQTTDTQLGLHPHTDKNIVTILYQNQVDGLEVKTKDGEWINVKLSPDSFVVMIGDSLYAWANGLLYSAYHRVMMTGNEARYSAGLFSIPKAGYMIKAPEELIDEQHPLLFRPFDHVEFLKFYYTEAGQRESALKTYCGV